MLSSSACSTTIERAAAVRTTTGWRPPEGLRQTRESGWGTAHHWVRRPAGRGRRAVRLRPSAGDWALASWPEERPCGTAGGGASRIHGPGRRRRPLRIDLVAPSVRRSAGPGQALSGRRARGAALSPGRRRHRPVVRASAGQQRGIASTTGYADPDRVAVPSGRRRIGNEDSPDRARILATLAVERRTPGTVTATVAEGVRRGAGAVRRLATTRPGPVLNLRFTPSRS